MAIADQEYYKAACRRQDELDASPDDKSVQALNQEEEAFEAVMDGDLPRLRDLLASDLNINARTLRWVKGRNTRFPFPIHIHHTLLHVAIMRHHYEIANVLLDAGADPMERHIGILPRDLFEEYARWKWKYDTGQLLVPLEEYRLGRRLLYYNCKGDEHFAWRYPRAFRQSLFDQGPDSIAEIIPGKRGLRPTMP